MWVLKLLVVFFWAIGDAEANEEKGKSEMRDYWLKRVRDAVERKEGAELLKWRRTIEFYAVDIMKKLEAAYEKTSAIENEEVTLAEARVFDRAYSLMSAQLGPSIQYQNDFDLNEPSEYNYPVEVGKPSDLGAKYFGGTLKDVDFLEDDRLIWTFHYKLEHDDDMICKVTLTRPTEYDLDQDFGTKISTGSVTRPTEYDSDQDFGSETEYDLDQDFGSKIEYDLDQDFGSETDQSFGSEIEYDSDQDFRSKIEYYLDKYFRPKIEYDSDQDSGSETEYDSDQDFGSETVTRPTEYDLDQDFRSKIEYDSDQDSGSETEYDSDQDFGSETVTRPTEYDLDQDFRSKIEYYLDQYFGPKTDTRTMTEKLLEDSGASGTEKCVTTDGRVRHVWWREGGTPEYFSLKYGKFPLVAAKRLKRKKEKKRLELEKEKKRLELEKEKEERLGLVKENKRPKPKKKSTRAKRKKEKKRLEREKEKKRLELEKEKKRLGLEKEKKRLELEKEKKEKEKKRLERKKQKKRLKRKKQKKRLKGKKEEWDGVLSLINSIDRFYKKRFLKLTKKFAEKYRGETVKPREYSVLEVVVMGLSNLIIVAGVCTQLFGN